MVEDKGGRVVEDETTTMEVENDGEFGSGGRRWRVREEETNGGFRSGV